MSETRRYFAIDAEIQEIEDSIREQFPVKVEYKAMYLAGLKLLDQYLREQDLLDEKGWKPQIWDK